MQVAIAAPHVDDEGDLRAERGDVSEILLRADAQISPARLRRARQIGNDVLKPELVREKVVRTKRAVRLREVGDEPPEFLIPELRREGVGRRTKAFDGRHEREGADEDGRGGGKEENEAASHHDDAPAVTGLARVGSRHARTASADPTRQTACPENGCTPASWNRSRRSRTGSVP